MLATMVIFACGVITGSLLTRNWSNPTPAITATLPTATTSTNKAAAMPLVGMQRPEFLRRLDRQLDLTPQQHDDIARIIKESHQRTQRIWQQIAPEMTDELKRVREDIRLVLTPEQRKRWNQMMRQRRRAETIPSPNPAPRLAPENSQTNTL